RRALSGEELVNDQGTPQGLLTILPSSDWVLRKYVQRAKCWATVSPVVLPGHDDRRPTKTEQLIGKALQQAGFSPELIKQTTIGYRKVGYHPGVDLASRYLPPKNLSDKPRYHLKLEFPHEINGPIAVGGGRF